MVMRENTAVASWCCSVMPWLLSRDLMNQAMAAAPTIFGMAKTTQAQTPQLRTSRTGRNMPMHQVQEQARKKAQSVVLTMRRHDHMIKLLPRLGGGVKCDDALADALVALAGFGHLLQYVEIEGDVELAAGGFEL